MVHREEGDDLSKGFGRGNSSNEVSKRRDNRPKHLVVRVETPKIASIAGAELDVSDTRLFFQVPGKYRLDIPLPFEVDGDEGKAKFDKTSRRLEVTLPVKPARVEPPLRFTEPRVTEEAEEETEQEKPLVEEIPSEEGRETASDSSGPAKVDQAEAKAAASAAAAVAAKQEFENRGETENQRRWREMHEKRAPEPKPPPPPASEPVEVGEDVDGFMSAARFAGARTGYVFKRDDRGLGYYLDNPKPASRPREPEAPPAAKSTVSDLELNPEPKNGRATEPTLDDSDAEDEVDVDDWDDDEIDGDFGRKIIPRGYNSILDIDEEIF